MRCMAAEVKVLDTARGERTARLEEAGWSSKERLGRTIWAHPKSGCWYSEAVALELEMENRRREGEGEEE